MPGEADGISSSRFWGNFFFVACHFVPLPNFEYCFYSLRLLKVPQGSLWFLMASYGSLWFPIIL